MGKETPHQTTSLLTWLISSMVYLMFIKQVIGQSSDRNYTLIKSYCRPCDAWNGEDYLSNLNSSLSNIRMQLSAPQIYIAFAHAASNSELVYSFALCREYLSTSHCLACFDTAANQTKSCRMADGGHAIYDDCGIRYEKSDDLVMHDDAAPFGVCSNETTNQPIPSFIQNIEELLSDILVATPKTSTFYVASTRQVSIGNTTVYAIAQCDTNISRSLCQTCLNRAYKSLHDCLPNMEGRVTDSLCFVRYSETPFFQNNQTTNILPFLSEGSLRKSADMIAVGSGGGALFLLIFAFWLWNRQRKKVKDYRRRSAHVNVMPLDTSELQGGRSYSYQDLKKATNNFAEECLIGKGGFAEVFKATVDTAGVVVAVKKLYMGTKVKKEFENEVKLISNARHRNLILQLGWCIDGPELLLVLEYMPQGSLDKFLWGERKGFLNWKQRSDIILGIARGLAHLHGEFHIKIIHRDIKSCNIQLDDEFQPKIADFGLARFHPEDETHVSTRFAGTMGYTAPEYANRGHLSEKVDIYSFGIVALEVISDRWCCDVNYSGPRMEYLLDHAWQLYEKGAHIKLTDEALDPNEYEEEKVMKIVEIALMCTQSPPSLRPTMSGVVLMLSSEPTLGQRQMSRPTFFDANRRIHKGEI